MSFSEILPATEQNIAKAARLLADGQLVALPTETVYGLAADALNGRAVAEIYAVKNRPRVNPLIVHVCDADMAARYVDVSPLARELMRRFWPGPLSLVLPLRAESGIDSLVTAGLPTLAVRCPQGVFADIIRRIGRPLAAPSANISGRISPTAAQAAAQALGEKIPLVIDGGICSVGVESTIIAVEKDKMTLLRAGGITREDIEAAGCGKLHMRRKNSAIAAPGQMQSHYAPAARVRLKAREVYEGEALLAFGSKRAKNYQCAAACLNLSETGNLREAAHNLFAYLEQLDAVLGKSDGIIAVEPVPAKGAGEAINDRLRRAAAER